MVVIFCNVATIHTSLFIILIAFNLYYQRQLDLHYAILSSTIDLIFNCLIFDYVISSTEQCHIMTDAFH